MAKTDALFSLIKSLTKSEKSYFKKYIAGSDEKSDKKYMLLFEAIEKQSEYDEAAIKKKFKDEQFIRQIAVAKNYLFNVILKSLKLNQLEASVDNVIFNLLTECDILYNKTMYRESEKKLLKALDMAEKYEKFPALMEVYFRLHRYIIQRADFLIEDKTSKLYSDQIRTLEKVHELVSYRKISYDFRKITYGQKSMSDKKIAIEELLQQPLLDEKFQPSSLRSRLLFYNIRGLIYQGFFNDHKKGFEINQQFVDEMLSHPEFSAEERVTTLAALNNFILDAINLKKKDVFDKYIKILSELPIIYPEDEIRIFEKVLMLKISFHLKMLEVEDGEKYAIASEQKLSEIDHFLNPDFWLAIHDGMALVYFLAGNYSKCISHLNKIFQSKLNIRPDIFATAHLIYLMIQFEKKDWDHLEYHIKFADKFITQNLDPSSYEINVIQLFKNYLKCKNEKEKQTLFEEFIEKFDRKNYGYSGNMVFDFFNIRIWAEAKMRNKGYLEVLKKHIPESV